MPFSQIVVLDCGASRVAAGVFSLNGGGLCLERLALEPLAALGEDTADRWLENTTAALGRLGGKDGYGGPAVVILPPHTVLLKHLKVPPVAAAQRERVVRFEVEQSLPVVADIIWDTIGAGEPGTGGDLLLAATKRAVVDPLCAAAAEGGFDVRAILPSVLAMRAADELPGPAATGDRRLILSVGARSASLLLIEGARFAARSWSLGTLTKGPAETLALRLAQETTRSLLHFQRQNGLAAPARVLLTGGASRDPALASLLHGKLALSVELLEVTAALNVSPEAIPGAAALGALPELAGAAALHLWPGRTGLNLLPPAMRRDDLRRGRRPWLVAAGVLLLGALVPPFLHYHRIAGAARADLASLEAALGPLRAREARQRDSFNQLAAIRTQLVQLQTVRTRRGAWVRLLADVQERFESVEDVWLENLETIPATGGSPARLVVSGRMLDKKNPLAKVSPETFTRVKVLLADIVDSPLVAAVEGERFDNSRPGILKFDFVVAIDPAHPL